MKNNEICFDFWLFYWPLKWLYYPIVQLNSTFSKPHLQIYNSAEKTNLNFVFHFFSLELNFLFWFNLTSNIAANRYFFSAGKTYFLKMILDLRLRLICRWTKLKITRGGRNVENQNIEGSERQNFFLDDQNVKSQKIRTSKITLLKRTSKVRFSNFEEVSKYFWLENEPKLLKFWYYLWCQKRSERQK